MSGNTANQLLAKFHRPRFNPQCYPEKYSTTALHDFTADPEDPYEMSCRKGEVLDIIDQNGKWWWVIRPDGNVGKVPSNHLRNGHGKLPVKVLRDYNANEKDAHEISLRKGEDVIVLDHQGTWWQVRKADGSKGCAPAECLYKDYDGRRTSVSAEIRQILSTSLWWQEKRADPFSGLSPPDELDEAPIVYKYTAKARYSHTADPSDPNELSFRKGDLFEIAHKRGKWWLARNADGSTGIVPYTFVEIIATPAYENYWKWEW
ncbi:hypothetical protein R3P38DRAFT_2870241 [Favolaschia claudopus]|uniref:SH3 domain-containing protein n=1 Tax=Favolaschia claudopus TaxID=2862362 RepID=A0AAW0DBR1_9AGAR